MGWTARVLKAYNDDGGKMSTLKFAHELARFEDYLDWIRAGGGDGRRGLKSALAASYKVLIGGLVELDEHLDSAGRGASVPGKPGHPRPGHGRVPRGGSRIQARLGNAARSRGS